MEQETKDKLVKLYEEMTRLRRSAVEARAALGGMPLGETFKAQRAQFYDGQVDMADKALLAISKAS